MTVLDLSYNASQTVEVESFSFNAPTGHTNTHCPQLVQTDSPKSSSSDGPMKVENPRWCGFISDTPCISLHTVTQRRQRMHFELSRTMEGLELSITSFDLAPSYLNSMISVSYTHLTLPTNREV